MNDRRVTGVNNFNYTGNLHYAHVLHGA